MRGGATDISVSWPTQPEFQFLQLYADASEAFEQVVAFFRELKKIPRFA